MAPEALNSETMVVLGAARSAARRLGQPQVHPEHLLIGLLTGPNAAATILTNYGMHRHLVESRITQLYPQPIPADSGHILSEQASRVVTDAIRITAELGHGKVDPTAVARALLRSGDARVAELLSLGNLAPQTVIAALDAAEPGLVTVGAPEIATGRKVSRTQSRKGDKSALAPFAVDLVAMARAGKLQQAIGREDELRRVMVTLARRSKNSPCLVGSAGVGKTAIAEGLAVEIASGRAPQVLADRPLVSLDVAALIAGTKLRGDFEDRLKKAIDEAIATHAILFIDEIHQILGAGARAGGLSLAGMLKEPLARGQLSVLGATTADEYSKHIEQDAALERRFQKIDVDEPSRDDAVTLMKAIAPAFAKHHQVVYTDDALTAAVDLAVRYLPDRRLPDKAIDMIDEAGAAVAMRRAKAAQPTVSEVDADAVAEVVAKASGVPVAALDGPGSAHLRELSSRLCIAVRGQEAAIAPVVAAIRRRRVGVSDPGRPASFLFAGPTGVGKTRLAGAIADELSAGGGALIRVDMSEFTSRASVSRLVGAPPGHVGYGDTGTLVERVRRNPYAVVLFDELEKADPAVFDALLQVLEDGKLTDSTGKVADFSNAAVIFTSNIGVSQGGNLGFGTNSRDQSFAIRSAVKEFFRPEFLNRLDEVLVFQPLTKATVASIANDMIAEVAAQAAAKGVTLRATDEALVALADAGFDSRLGARPLRRAILDKVITPLTDLLLSGQLPSGSAALVGAQNGAVTVSVAPPAP